MTPDLLLYRTPFPYRRTFYPLGFAATIATNYETVIAAAESAWGNFKRISDEPAVEFRLAVSESQTGERPQPQMPRGQGHLISFVHDQENYAITDLRAGFSYGWITPAVAREATYVRYHFIENCVYIMLQSMYLTPAHAA